MARLSLQDDVVPSSSHPADGKGVERRRSRPSGRRILLLATIAAVVVCALGAVLFLPIRFPSVVSTYATIAPVNRWVLSKATDGQLIASTFNYKTGLSEGFRVSTFNQGSSVHFSLHAALVPGRAVSAGDTIASIYSSDVAERLIALHGQLDAARRLLEVNATGAKSAIVTEAEKRLVFAQRRREEHRKVEERTQLLFDQHLIPQGEYDRIQSEANEAQDEISLAESNLEAARTGAKPEQLALGNANIAALESEIEAVTQRAATFTLTTPISGTVISTFSEGTLLTIASPEYVALIPVRWIDYRRVAATPKPSLVLLGLSQAVGGTVIAMNHELQVLRGQEVLIATGRIDAPPADVMPGMLVPCRITCTPVTALEYGRQVFQAATASRPLLGAF